MVWRVIRHSLLCELAFYILLNWIISLELFQCQSWPIVMSGMDLIGIAQVRYTLCALCCLKWHNIWDIMTWPPNMTYSTTVNVFHLFFLCNRLALEKHWHSFFPHFCILMVKTRKQTIKEFFYTKVLINLEICIAVLDKIFVMLQ